MNLLDWAKKHNISQSALNELFGIYLPPLSAKLGHSEEAVQTAVRLEATRQGCRLFRNNVGVFMDDRNIPVRYGLCNESKQMNQNLKSSDLIGIRPVIITGAMVGSTIGQFMAIEVKHSDWKWSGNAHEEAQMKFLQLIEKYGGYGKFVTDPSQL